MLGGRGAGKTRAGAEWVREQARTGRFRRIALVAPTFHDVREVMIDGASGIRALPGERPIYEATRRRLLWRSGAEAHCFSAEDPESLRGPQFDAAWCDEIAYWPRLEEALRTLNHGLRLGVRPLMLATTTPRPVPALKLLVARKDTTVTRSKTFDNAHNLSPAFVEGLQEGWGGTAYERQELYGELIDDPEGALWRRAMIEEARAKPLRACTRVVVAVDPPVSVSAKADACGIVAAGAYEESGLAHGIVLADASIRGATPQGWSARAAALAEAVGAGEIIAEANNGGELVRDVLRLAAPHLPVRLVHARRGKRDRASPVAWLYEQGRIAHACAMPVLEDEMCAFGASPSTHSPDRVDALVWALTHLLLDDPRPRLRAL